MTSAHLASPQQCPCPALRQTLPFPGRPRAPQERSPISGEFHLSTHPKAPRDHLPHLQVPGVPGRVPSNLPSRAHRSALGSLQSRRGGSPALQPSAFPVTSVSSENSPQDSASSWPPAALPTGHPGRRMDALFSGFCAERGWAHWPSLGDGRQAPSDDSSAASLGEALSQNRLGRAAPFLKPPQKKSPWPASHGEWSLFRFFSLLSFAVSLFFPLKYSRFTTLC